MLITYQKLPSRTSFTMSMIHVWLVKLKPLIKLKSSYMIIWRSLKKKIKTRFQGFGKFEGFDRFRWLEGIGWLEGFLFWFGVVLFRSSFEICPIFSVRCDFEYLTGKNWCSYLTKKALVKVNARKTNNY